MIQRIKNEGTALLQALKYRVAYPAKNQQETIDRFHQLYYDAGPTGKTWQETSWFGVPVRKSPFDLWQYQQMLFRLKPDLIVETGTLLGGSAFYFATLLDLLKSGRIITIDIDDAETSISREKTRPALFRPAHPRIEYVRGSSTDPAIVARVRKEAEGLKSVLVILDSDHSQKHVYEELKAYAPIVTKGSYVVVEDSNVNSHPVFPEHGPGPFEAIHQFLAETRGFEIDRSCESHFMTFNPDGWLKKI
ncbi:MAG: class I SAM-dependent methyltransferase [Elusimicrobia bacterium]|nr:class I SAM-dependent methyltransferase [Elusimicrobiota bacterium]